MFSRVGHEEENMPQDRFIAVETPSTAEGIGRALQAAFRDGFELPPDLRASLEKLESIRL